MKGNLRISGGRRLQSPNGITTRPTTARVREAVMNLLAERLKNCDWLDLYSGSGVMGCEALLRGAQNVVAVEKNRQTAQICKSNLISIATPLNKQEHIEVFCNEVMSFIGDGFHQLKKTKLSSESFDIVYCDPPYGSDIYPRLLVKLLEGNWLRKGSIVIYEHSSKTTLTTPKDWREIKRRIYGTSAVLLVSPP